MQRPLIIAGNWKMHKTLPEAVSFIEQLSTQVGEGNAHAFVAPPFTALAACAQAAAETSIILGAQNVSDEKEGAYTGEVSAKMARDAGAQFAIIGHSERRFYFSETGHQIHKKIVQAFSEEVFPILCIGETLEDRERGKSESVLLTQLEEALKDLSEKQVSELAIAYEPVWAIGTGKAATPELAEEAHSWIRQYIEKQWNRETAEKVPILYGGSVKPENAKELLKQPNIDGALVGGASLDVESFIQILKAGETS